MIINRSVLKGREENNHGYFMKSYFIFPYCDVYIGRKVNVNGEDIISCPYFLDNDFVDVVSS